MRPLRSVGTDTMRQTRKCVTARDAHNNFGMQKENNMKIAVPSKGSEVDNHFGHCDHFQVFTISDTKEIISTEWIPPLDADANPI